MQREEEIISFKTDAWKSREMTASYAAQMHSSHGTNTLKNAVEVNLCRRYAVGTSILDVGIGTGRASLPLLRDGKKITGVDSSREMLEQCRREAGDFPIDLFEADLTKLPFEDGTFDSLLSLNVAVHFPNWREALAEWSRVVRKDGRIVFDIHSFDHLEAVAKAHGITAPDLLTPQQRSNVVLYAQYVQSTEIVEAAEKLGLNVVSLVPFGLTFTGNVNYWRRDSLLFGALGDRALSWLPIDEKMFAFAQFIEEELVARLSVKAAGRFMVVLEKRRDPSATRRSLDRATSAEAAFLRGDLAGFVDENEVDSVLARLREHLDHEPNCVLAAMGLSTPCAAPLRPAIEHFLGSQMTKKLFDAHDRLVIERREQQTLERIRAAISTDATATFSGIDLSGALDYTGFRSLLESTFFAPAGTTP